MAQAEGKLLEAAEMYRETVWFQSFLAWPLHWTNATISVFKKVWHRDSQSDRKPSKLCPASFLAVVSGTLS